MERPIPTPKMLAESRRGYNDLHPLIENVARIIKARRLVVRGYVLKEHVKIECRNGADVP